MKVCMLTRAYVTNSSGGMEDYTQKLCEGLVKQGVQITLITSRHPQNIKSEVFNGVEIHYLDNPNPLSYKGYFFRALKKFNELHAVHSFDIIHSQSSAALAFLLSKKVPIVVTMHGTLTTETQLNPNIFKKKNIFQKMVTILKLYKGITLHWLTKILLLKSSAIIVASEYSRTKFTNSKIDKKIVTIHHGINDELLIPEDKHTAKKILGWNNEKVLLCLGRLVEEKGIQVVLKALGESNLKSQDIALQIIGKGQYEAKLREQVKELELEDKVNFVGYVEDKDKYLYYSAADLLIYPELTSPAFGLVAAEAMACATAVISTDHEATREVIGDEDYLFKVHDSRGLADKIESFLKQSEKEQRNIGKKFYERQKRLFAYSRMVQNTMDIYKTVRGS